MRSLTINLFFRCNAKCIFCVVGLTGGSHPTRELSLEEVTRILMLGAERECTMVTFSGGEPTVYPWLGEAVAAAKALRYRKVEIKTNGIRLASRSYTKSVIEAGADTFSISIQGPRAEVHDHLVGVPGAFEKALRGAYNVKEMGKQVTFPTCIQVGNYQDLPDTINLLLSLEPEYCLPTFIEPSGSAAFRFDDVVPRYCDVEPFVSRAMGILVERSPNRWAVHGFPMCLLAGFEQYSFDLRRGVEVLENETTRGGYFEYEKAHYRTKAEKCAHCAFEPVCGGPWRIYVDHFGWDEFEPITDRTPRDVIPLPLLLVALYPTEFSC